MPNSVIKHILNRQNKNVPVDDGRHLALIMLGGNMVGIRGAGGCIALEELGLAHVFDSIWTVSAGFANASYMLSDQARFGTSIYYDDLPKGKFVNFLRFWKIVDIDLILKIIQTTKHLKTERILESKTKLYPYIQNLNKKRAEFLEVHNYNALEYFKLFGAVISIRYLHPGSVKIGDHNYEDLPWHSLSYTDFINQAISQSKATDVLIIYNYNEQAKFKNLNPEKIYEISPPRNWHLSRFEMNSEILKAECKKMGRLVKNLFGIDEDISLDIQKDKFHENRN